MDVKEITDCPDCGFILEYYEEDDDTLDGCDTCKSIMQERG
jgi:DNA-directed RNA polymerase subunit M/transcription elongation factor TFIIS